MPIFMYHAGLISRPNFYISEFLENNRDEYYNRLLAVSNVGDWTGWCEFFLTAIIKQAEVNQIKAQKILRLYQEKKDWIVVLTRSQYAVRALDWMFVRPIFRTSAFAESVEIPKSTATRILRVARDAGMLREARPSSGRRAAVLVFSELIEIAEGRHIG